MGWVEWLAVGIGILALPTVFQMVWGRPHIEFTFGTVSDDLNTVLQCTIYNRPINSRVLRAMGLRRDAATVYAAYKIHGCDFVTELIYPSLASYQHDSKQVELVAGPVGASMGIIFIRDGNAYIVEDPRSREKRDVPMSPINAGTYDVGIVVFCGEKNFVKEAQFVITENAVNSYWVH
jgi:hypothetical protein